MNNNDESCHQPDSGWSTLWLLVSQQKGRLTVALLVAVFAAALELTPFMVLFLAAEQLLLVLEQSLSTEAAAEQLFQLAIWMLAALVVKSLVYAVAYYFSHQAAFLILANTRRTLVARLAWAPLCWLQARHSGQLKQMVLQDVARIENLIAHHSVELTVAVLSPVLVTLYLFWLDWRLALAALAVAPLAIISSLLFMRGMNRQYDDYQQRLINLNNTILEYLRNRTAMKLFLQDGQQFASLVRALNHYYALVTKITRRTVPRWALFTSILGANLLLILPLGQWLWQQQQLALSTLVMVLLLSGGMLRPLLKISHFFSESKEALAGVRRLSEVLALPEKEVPGKETPEQEASETDSATAQNPVAQPFEADVRFEQIDFAYPDQEHLLQQFSLTLPSGSTTLLLGPSGSGKSTLAQLLAGLLLPSQGRILLNDMDLAGLDNSRRSRLVAVATQEAFLFKGTIRQNLMLARDQISDQALEQAIEVAQASELMARLPNGYDTLLNETGGTLSGGERQRLALARALLADTPILVLDEATAFADNLTQQAFYQALKRHYPRKTVLIIAHHLAGLQQVDQIVLIDQGRIQAQGRHVDLLAHQAAYQRLWALQQQSHNWRLRDIPVSVSRPVSRSALLQGES